MLEEAGEVRVGTGGAPLPAAELKCLVEGADAIISLPTDPVDGSVADLSGPGLKVVANVAVGYDNISLSDLASRGIAVTNTPDVIAGATADLALALILMVSRRLGEGERLIRNGTDWALALRLHARPLNGESYTRRDSVWVKSAVPPPLAPVQLECGSCITTERGLHLN